MKFRPVSTALEEVRSPSDRLVVTVDGRIMGEAALDAPESEIGMMMAGAGRAAA